MLPLNKGCSLCLTSPLSLNSLSCSLFLCLSFTAPTPIHGDLAFLIPSAQSSPVLPKYWVLPLLDLRRCLAGGEVGEGLRSEHFASRGRHSAREAEDVLAIRRLIIFFHSYPVPSNVLGSLHLLSYVFIPPNTTTKSVSLRKPHVLVCPEQSWCMPSGLA